MRPFPLTVLEGGIDRQQVKGGASARRLYDLQNGYITNAGSVVPREGTIRTATLDSSTVGLAAANGKFNIFSSAFSTATLPVNYQLNVLSDPNDRTQPVTKIWFAKPFMGFEYVVAQFGNGDIFHYWLQNNGTWTSNTVYTTASIVLPPVLNGLAYQGVRDFPAEPTWTPETLITVGNFVEPTVPTGFVYEAVAIAGSPQGCLFHFDGTSGSVVFPDASGYGTVLTPHGVASVSTAQAKFGTGSLAILSTTSYVSTAISTNSVIDITNGDFTIECFYYPQNNPGAPTTQRIFDLAATGNTSQIRVETVSNGNTVTALVRGGNIGSAVATNLTYNQWNHVAISVSGTSAHIFINGVELTGSPKITSTNVQLTSLTIGAQAGGSAQAWGFIDDFRITKGMALYTANFTPPATVLTFASATPGHTGASEPSWPTVAGGTIQEFGDFNTSASVAGATQGNGFFSTASALGSTITDRYGNSSTVANSGIFSTSSGLGNIPTAATKITTWKAGTNYAPGAVVIPTTNQGAFINAIPNGDFEGGAAIGGWTFTDPGGTIQWAYSSSLPYQGSNCISLPSGASIGAGGALATMTSYSLVTPGQSVTASAYLNPNNSGSDLTLWIQLNWYDLNDAILSSSGSQQNEQTGGGYRKTSITATAPVGAVHVRVSIGAGSGTNSRNAGFADLVSWNLETPSAVTNFLFEAVQPVAGSSGTTEPTWPTTLAATVIDNQVTWEAIGTSIITWQAIPLMQSGATAPTFPTIIGNSVLDPSTFTDSNGRVIATTMSWVAIDRHISDPKNPHTSVAVTIGASHVFAGDNDIVDFSAAVNPTDWSSTNNAGYLPTGLNNYGDNPIAMLALYRSNLVAFNAGGYQMWQIDPDPQNMALLDAQPVGSIWPRAAQSVANDLLFLTEVGVRNLGTVGATANMAIGNTGQPVDPLIQAALTSATYDPFSIYYPGRGQYMLIYGPQMFVLTMNGMNKKSWSRYIFPEVITDATLNAGYLYFRTITNKVWQFNVNAVGIDDGNSIIASAASVPFNGLMQWPYIDASALGVNKMLVGIDIVGEGSCTMQMATNQVDKSTFNDNPNFATSTGVTTGYFLAIDDTLPGEPLPLPLNAASYSMILTFTGSSSSPNAWSWTAANLYLMDQRGGGITG